MTLSDSPNQTANLIIAGVNKAGSTSLFYYLSAHPDVCGSRDKETCYFLPILYGEPVQPVSEYAGQFANCKAPIRLEATPGYIYGGEKMAKTIRSTLGNVKIVILLKDPVERVLSFYHRKKTTFQLPSGLTLKKYVDRCLEMDEQQLKQRENHLYSAVEYGIYHKYLSPWITVFGDDLKILFFDDLKSNERLFVKKLSSWIGIDESFYDEFEFDVKNKSHNYKNRLMHRIAVSANNTGKRFWRTNPGLKKAVMQTYYKLNGSPVDRISEEDETVRLLKKIYEPHNVKLRELLESAGVSDMPAWLESTFHTV